jgi:superfamily I DNA and RNA helicase
LKVAGLKLRKPTGTFDAAGNALWTEGELLVDSVYRIKGQSAPAVIFCEVDFDELNQHTKSKLFVGMTRAQIHLEVLLTEKAANLLASAV